MGFFNELGRQVEQFKRTATNAAAGRAAYRCRACDERFESQHDQCPECGDGPVESTQPEE